MLSAISAIAVGQGGSCIECGLRIGTEQVKDATGLKGVILLSDGQANKIWNGGSLNAKQASITQSVSGRALGIEYYVLGFGAQGTNQIDEATLKSIAGPASNYSYQPDSTLWTSTFLSFIPKICN